MTRRELRRIVAEFRAGILDGRASDRMCFAVCAPLQSLLALYGVETRLVESDFSGADEAIWLNHVWLERPDGTIIDPTADQFSARGHQLPAVYIGAVPAMYVEWMKQSSEQGDHL